MRRCWLLLLGWNLAAAALAQQDLKGASRPDQCPGLFGGRPLATLVSGELLKEKMADMPGRLIAVLDCCHSGSVAKENGRAERALTDDLVRDLVTEDYGVITMCSSLGREFSLESSAVKAGFFTLALVEGLSGGADANRDGAVFFNELDVYAARRVRELSEGLQNPVTGKPATIRSFPLAIR